MIDTRKKRFNKYVMPIPESGCWIWIGAVTKEGYGIFGGPLQTLHYAHRYSWNIHKGEIPNGTEVCHKCDTPACVRPDHLFLGTHADNMKDASNKGRIVYGERHKSAKLTIKDVTKIKELLGDGNSQSSIAMRYKVSPTTISYIKSGKRWRRLKCN